MKQLTLCQAQSALVLNCFDFAVLQCPAVKMLSPMLKTSEDDAGPKQILAPKRIIIPVMWTSEAEVRTAQF